MDALLNAWKAHAGAMDAAQGRVRVGTVQSVNPASHTARVTIQPEGTLTGWLPVKAWQRGIGSPPVIGDQAVIEPQEGDAEHGIITGIIYSDASRAPQFNGAPAQGGEFLYVNPQSGSALYLSNDGKMTLKDAHNATIVLPNDGTALIQDAHGSKVNLTNDGKIAVTGELDVTGSIKVNGVAVTVP
jgi:phage baseplate assembly protein gpV